MAAVAATAEPVRDETPRRPWWTEADQAELDCLLHELVVGIFTHRERCARCIAHRNREQGSLPCPHVGKAIAVVVDWHQARDLRSYARWVRLQRELFELEQDVVVHKLRGRR